MTRGVWRRRRQTPRPLLNHPPPKFHLGVGKGAGLRMAGIFSALCEGRSGTDSSGGAQFFLNLRRRKEALGRNRRT